MPTQDFNLMQAQAIRRAREMQRRATPPNNIQTYSSTAQITSSQTRPHKNSNEACPPNEPQSQCTPPEQHQCPPCSENKKPNSTKNRNKPNAQGRDSKSHSSQFPPVNDIFGHHNPWTQNAQTPFCKNACPIKNILGMSGKGFDQESMLLMAIMLLLATDGGDRMLMMALLYIMT